MNNTVLASLISVLSISGILFGGVYLLYAMLKNNIHLIKNALTINLFTALTIIIIFALNKKIPLLPSFVNSNDTVLQIITIGLFVLLAIFALIGIAYYSRSKYMPLVVIKSSFALSTLLVLILFSISIKAKRNQDDGVTFSSKNKFVEVDSYSSYHINNSTNKTGTGI